MVLSLVHRLRQRAITVRLTWAVASFGGVQAIRLATNVVLARLLAPEIFGIMQIVNAVRTGAELLSDVGIGQNIVASKHGDDPDFLRTAWTIQVIRGVLIGTLLMASASLIARIYPIPDLAGLLVFAALVPLLAGFESPARFLLQRHQLIGRITVFELAVALVSSLIQVTITWFDRTAWSLVYGAAAGTLLLSVLSFRLAPIPPMRLVLRRGFVSEILNFAKWIFLATALYFAATNFDRLYFGQALPLAMLGIYGVARSLADMFGMLIGRVCNMVVFPVMAASRLEGRSIDSRVRSYRGKVLILAAVGLGGFVAISDLVIDLLYDDRYLQAARVLPVLSLGVWFVILAGLGEALLLGRGKPQYQTFAHGLKLAWILAAVPLALHNAGFAAAVVVVAASDFFRCLPLFWGLRRERLFFPLQDLAATIVMLVTALAARQLFHLLGLTADWAALWP